MQPSCSADRDFIKFSCRCQNAVYRCQRAACGSIKQPKFAAAAACHFTALLQRFFQPFCSAAAALFISYGYTQPRSVIHPKKSLLKSSHAKNTCQISPPKKIPESKISNPQKCFCHPCHLKSDSPPLPGQKLYFVHQNMTLTFPHPAPAMCKSYKYARQ